MKFQIGVITAENSLKNIQQALSPKQEQVDLIYLPYDALRDIVTLYQENVDQVDGLLFSGAFPRDYLEEINGPIKKPHIALDVRDRDYYIAIARLLASHPEIDFSRVHFDAPDCTVQFGEIFPPERMPKVATRVYAQYVSSRQTLYDEVMSFYRMIWKTGEFDLIFTRLTNLRPILEAEGIAYQTLFPSSATIQEQLFGLINSIQSNRLENALPACCLIAPVDPDPTQEDLKLLTAALSKFNGQQNMSFLQRFFDGIYEMNTSSETIKQVTTRYTTCQLTAFLREVLPFKTHIGWGVGFDVVSAQKAAKRALRSSQADPNCYTYLVTQEDEMYGPLRSDRNLTYVATPSNRMLRLGKALGISAQNLEKLNSLKTRKGIQEISSEDLTFYLNITPRSATRILKKLRECGGATLVKQSRLAEKGRPIAIYSIDLEAIQLD